MGEETLSNWRFSDGRKGDKVAGATINLRKDRTTHKERTEKNDVEQEMYDFGSLLVNMLPYLSASYCAKVELDLTPVDNNGPLARAKQERIQMALSDAPGSLFVGAMEIRISEADPKFIRGMVCAFS